MNDDVRKLRHMVEGLPKSPDEYDINDIRVADIIVEQWLAEHPADDGEVIDDPWMKAIGWRQIGNTWYPPESAMPPGVTMPIVLWCRVDGAIRLGGGNEWISRNDATRGDLRLLCRALGIDLKSPTQTAAPPQRE